MQKYIVSVSKKNNSIWKIYFYDENFQIHSQRINPLLIWYYKLIRRHRRKAVCPNCGNRFLVLINWYDKNMDCPVCMPQEQLLDEEDFDEYDEF